MGGPLAMKAARLLEEPTYPLQGPGWAWGEAAPAEVTLPAGERRFS